MEVKRLIAVGIEGSARPTDPPPGALWVRSDEQRGTMLFGVQKRSEDDAERALRYACLIQDETKRLIVKEVSVRIHHRDPDFNWESEFREDLRALRTGEVLVSPPIAKIYDRLFLFERLEEEHGPRFFLRGERQRPGRLRGVEARLVPLIGRNAEIVRFEETLEQVSEDQGQVVGIVGEAGVGKTRLVAAFQEILKKRSIPFAEGAHAIRDTQPYRGVRQVVSALVHGLDAQADEVETDFLGLLLHPEKKTERLRFLSDSQIRQGLFHSIRQLIHMKAHSPLAVILEDLHWADSNTIELLEHVMEDMESSHLLLILSHRSEWEGRWKRRLNYNEMVLQSFTDDELGRFISASVGVDKIAAQARTELSRLSMGNPLYVEEILRQALEQVDFEIETEENGQKILKSRHKRIDMPGTLRSLLASRFDRLEEFSRDVLRWASLLGLSFDAEELEGLTPSIHGEHWKGVMTGLIDRGYLTEQSVFPRKMYRFRHDFIFEVVRESLENADRRRRQSAVGQFLVQRFPILDLEAVNRIADHFLDSDRAVSAVEWATKAGERNFDLFLYSQARVYFERAIEAGKTLPFGSSAQSDRLYEGWIRTLLALGDYEAARRVLGEWSQYGALRSPRSQGVYFLLWAELQRGRSDDARCLDAAERAIEALGNDPSTRDALLRAFEYRLDALVALGRGREMVHEGFKMLRELSEANPETALRVWSRMAGETIQQGEISQALDYLAKTEKFSSHRIPPADGVNVHLRFAEAARFVGDYEKTLRRLSEALRVCREAGMRALTTSVSRHQAAALLGMGDCEQAKKTLEDGLKEARSLQDPFLEAQLKLSLAEWFLEIGTDQEATRLVSAVGLGITSRLGVTARCLRESLLARLFLRANKPKEAADLLRSAAKRYNDNGHRVLFAEVLARALSIEALHGLRPSGSLAEDYGELCLRVRHLRLPPLQRELWITGLDLASSCGKTFHPDVEDSDLNAVLPVSLRLRSFMALRRYQAARGEKESAARTLKKHEDCCEALLRNVPFEYREVFQR
ncbi:MAG TPA: AAA family ATPase, partial [Bdellovibrionota bacterium]|nr:AAA family ATPase [Bdellovibrionota bacterium]